MTIDLDALEALYRDDKKRPVGTIGQADVLALIAELRQERERNRPVALRDLMDAQAALSRAEETIEAARAAWWSATEQGDNGLIYTDRVEDAMDEIWNAIGHADYDKQKEG